MMGKKETIILKKFIDEVNGKSPGGRHGKLQKLCGEYLICDGGPVRRTLREIHAEHEIGKTKRDAWPADIFAEWELESGHAYREIVEVEVDSDPRKSVTVGYTSVEDAFEKLDYIRKSNTITEIEARSAQHRIENKRDYNWLTASTFRFRPIKSGTIMDLLELGWDIRYESHLEKKLRRAKSGENVVSFCIPLHSYKRVLDEVRETPTMKVGMIYPFTESKEDGRIRIAGAIPVFQGIDLKDYHNAKKERDGKT